MRRFILAGAACGAAAIVLVAIYVIVGREPQPQPPAQPSAPAAPAAPSAPSASALLVRNGDMVEASGRVFAAPGQAVQFCPGDARAEPSDEPCIMWVEARSINLDALTRRTGFGDVVVGYARLRGTWHDRVLDVTSQAAPVEPTLPALPPLGPVPCDPPPGGWQPTSDVDDRAIHDYIEQHPGRFGAPWLAWPDGPPGTGTAAPGNRAKPAVLVVEVISGDVEQARTELSRISTGNLCVTQARPEVRPSGEVQRIAGKIMERLEPVMNDRQNGIYAAGDDPSGRLRIDFLVLDQRLHDQLAQVGLDDLILDPWIRPVSG